jgi:hypothetical protein
MDALELRSISSILFELPLYGIDPSPTRIFPETKKNGIIC